MNTLLLITKGFLSLIILLGNISIYSEFLPWHVDANINIHEKHSSKKISSQKYDSISMTADLMIVFFQKYISVQDGSNCRFHPTCSQYGRLSIQKYGVVKGIIKTADRLLRCNPFTPLSDDWP